MMQMRFGCPEELFYADNLALLSHFVGNKAERQGRLQENKTCQVF